MIGFFRGCTARGVGWNIDARYWAEKLQPDGEKSILSFAEDHVRAYIRQAAAEGEAKHPGLAEEVEEELFSRYSDADLETEAGVKPALAALKFDGFRFDTSDWEFTEYDYWSSTPARPWPGPSPSTTPRSLPPTDAASSSWSSSSPGAFAGRPPFPALSEAGNGGANIPGAETTRSLRDQNWEVS
ncbi:hypothetical protein ACFWNF_00015 [Streptomyces anulatus]|uniref:hypothetical protein n=1 Tax=Streptomyces anulatus TaxID=1892 RepID=UPI00366010BC